MADAAVKPAALFAAPACLLCLAAAAAASLPAALLLTAILSLALLLCLLTAAGLRTWKPRLRGAACLLLAAGAAAVFMALSGPFPLLREWMGPPLLFTACILLCAPAALAMTEGKGKPLTSATLLTAGGLLLLIGSLRELLATGALFGVRLLPAGLSDSFGYGAAGVLAAGLLLCLPSLKGHLLGDRRLFRCPPPNTLSLGAGLIWRTELAALPAALLAVFIPHDTLLPWMLPLTALLAGLLLPEDGTVAAVAALLPAALLPLFEEGWLCLFLFPAVGILLGLGFWLWGLLYSKADNIHLPVPAKPGAAGLVTAALALLALSVLRF